MQAKWTDETYTEVAITLDDGTVVWAPHPPPGDVPWNRFSLALEASGEPVAEPYGPSR